jgi:hypothetical protein
MVGSLIDTILKEHDQPKYLIEWEILNQLEVYHHVQYEMVFHSIQQVRNSHIAIPTKMLDI